MPTTDDRDRVDEHYQAASRRLSRQRVLGVVLTIIGILLVICACVMFLLSVKPS